MSAARPWVYVSKLAVVTPCFSATPRRLVMQVVNTGSGAGVGAAASGAGVTGSGRGGVAPDAGSVCAMAGTIIAIDSSRTVALDLISASLAFWGEAPLCPVRSAIATL